MIARMTVSIAAGVALFLGVALTGCQTPGKTVAVEESAICPMCHTVTESSRFKNVTFKTHVCPDCKKVYVPSYSGGYLPDDEVVVCPKCPGIVDECPTCHVRMPK